MARVDSRNYILSGLYYSVSVRNTPWLISTPSKHETLTQCWFNAGSPSVTLAQHQTSTGSMPCVFWAACWYASGYCPSQCLLNARRASTLLCRIHSALVSTSCWWLQHTVLNQSWVNVGPPSVTLAHIERDTKHSMVTQYWAKSITAS